MKTNLCNSGVLLKAVCACMLPRAASYNHSWVGCKIDAIGQALTRRSKTIFRWFILPRTAQVTNRVLFQQLWLNSVGGIFVQVNVILYMINNKVAVKQNLKSSKIENKISSSTLSQSFLASREEAMVLNKFLVCQRIITQFRLYFY